ncbi:MAG TPA: hypothetical protein VL986_01860 [Terracidiphilus sp.]|nr:hypothetical protein [Terracidiphilus sp.]
MNGKSIFIALISCAAPAWIAAQSPTPPPPPAAAAPGSAPAAPLNPLHRSYHEGETLTYLMTGINESWHYTVRAEGVVQKAPTGAWFEEFRWIDMKSDGKPYAMAPSMADFRQKLSLDPGFRPSIPDLSKVDPKLIGPITDLMTFYVDLWLPEMMGVVKKPGDHFYFKMGAPSSWADGTHVVTGDSSIDFDFTMKSVDTAAGTAMLEVKHVPPEKPRIPLPGAWMQTPVADGANNWVEVSKRDDGKFDAAVGQETFTVDLTISLADGKILAGTMDNVVQTIERTCDDQALTQCTAPQPHRIERKIEIALEK